MNQQVGKKWVSEMGWLTLSCWIKRLENVLCQWLCSQREVLHIYVWIQGQIFWVVFSPELVLSVLHSDIACFLLQSTVLVWTVRMFSSGVGNIEKSCTSRIKKTAMFQKTQLQWIVFQLKCQYKILFQHQHAWLPLHFKVNLTGQSPSWAKKKWKILNSEV